MKRTTLLIIAVVCGILGMTALFFMKPQVSPQAFAMKGFVKSVHESGKATFITFIPDDFTVVSFDKNKIGSGKHTLTGHLQEYKGKVEFVVESVD